MTKRIYLIFLLTFIISVNLFGEKTKVACVGNSITYGSGITNRENNSYPAQLQQWLGIDYEVKNFGVSGATMLKKGNNPYWERPEYKSALNFQPDIVLIKLGTNDSKPQNWQYAMEYKKDYLEMINTFKELDSNPQVVLIIPVPVFIEERWGIRKHIVRDSVAMFVEEVIEESSCEFIDLFTPMLPYERFFSDKIHPDAIGASIMVEEIYKQFFIKKLISSKSKFNTATHPVPSPEYRGASAGWGEGKDWYSQHEAINQIGNKRDVNLVFLGNSITQGWGGEDRQIWSAAPEIWKTRYKPRRAANFGISGDRTQHILWRIENGNFDNIEPELIIVTVGVNNFNANTAEEIINGIETIVKKLNTKLPKTKILVLGPLPTGEFPTSKNRIKYNKIHNIMGYLKADENIYYENIGSAFLLPDRSLNYKYLRKDNIHLSPEGYERWSDILEPYIQFLLNE